MAAGTLQAGGRHQRLRVTCCSAAAAAAAGAAAAPAQCSQAFWNDSARRGPAGLGLACEKGPHVPCPMHRAQG